MAPQAPLVQKVQLRGQENSTVLEDQQPAKPRGDSEHEKDGECMQNASNDAFWPFCARSAPEQM
eukprot:gene13938-biopygen8060